MKKTLAIFSTLALAATFAAQTAVGQASSDIVGFVNSGSTQVNSDYTYNPSFHRKPEAAGKIATIVDADTIQIAGTPGWTANQWVSPSGGGTGDPAGYYVLVCDGAKEGSFALVSANGSDTLDLTFVSEDFTGVAVNDRIKIIPNWTLITLFPDTVPPALPDNSEVLLYSRSSGGINQSAATTGKFFATFGWFDGGTAIDNEVIHPDDSIIVRAPVGSSLDLFNLGHVEENKTRIVLTLASPTTDQDFRVNSGAPVPVALGTLINPGAAADGDEVLLFDNAEPGQNKSALLTATYFDGFGWFDGGTNEDGRMLVPGEGFIYRKKVLNSGGGTAGKTDTLVISYDPPYAN